MIFGAVIDDSLGDEVRVTVIATGFGTRSAAAAGSRRPPAPSPASARSEQPSELSDAELEIPSFLRDD